tara:strand:+ start:2038 stop:2433 length:396 start_codon:yes stop_codon:yes gene_type:complete
VQIRIDPEGAATDTARYHLHPGRNRIIAQMLSPTPQRVWAAVTPHTLHPFKRNKQQVHRSALEPYPRWQASAQDRWMSMDWAARIIHQEREYCIGSQSANSWSYFSNTSLTDSVREVLAQARLRLEQREAS